MAYATIGQIEQRLTDIETALMKADLGEVDFDPAERAEMRAEAESILQLLATEISKRTEFTPEEVRNKRQQVRAQSYIAAVAERYVKTHPEPDPKHEKIFAAAIKGLEDGTKTNEQFAADLHSIFFDGVRPMRSRENRTAWHVRLRHALAKTWRRATHDDADDRHRF